MKEKEKEMEKERIGGSSILWHTSKPLKFSRTRCYLPPTQAQRRSFLFFLRVASQPFLLPWRPTISHQNSKIAQQFLRSRRTIMAYTLPNLSTATLHQSSKDKASIIHQTPLSSSSSSLLSLPLPTSSPKPSSCISPRLAQVNLTAPPAQDKRHNHRDDFFVNLGLAVRTLREDLPQLFTRDLNYDIYR